MNDPMAYYATAAQILPVLALLVLVEVRAFGDWAGWWSRGGTPDEVREIPLLSAVVSLFYGALFLFGEIGALTAIEDGRPSGFDETIVPMAVNLYLILAVIYPMQMHVSALFERVPPLRRSRLRFWAWLDRRKASKSTPRDPPDALDGPPT
jgi:hypothetical protein